MNIILKQSFWSTIIIYLGVLIGFFNSIFLFPKFFNPDQIGLLRQIISASTMLIPLATFGVSASYIKFYPYFKCFKNGSELSQEEVVARGGNSSMIHVDWMIGSGAINIDGLDTEGNKIPVFRNGERASEL